MLKKVAPWLRAMFVVTALLLVQAQAAIAVDPALEPADGRASVPAPDVGRGGPAAEMPGEASSLAFPDTIRKGCAIRVMGFSITDSLPSGKPDRTDGPTYFGVPLDNIQDYYPGSTQNPDPYQTGDQITWLILVQNTTWEERTDSLCDINGAETLTDVEIELIVEGQVWTNLTLTYPEGNPGTLEPADGSTTFNGELAYATVTITVPPNSDGQLDIRTRAAAEDSTNSTAGPTNDTIDADTDAIPIQGPGFEVMSFEPSVTEAEPGELVDFTVTIENVRAGNIINEIAVVSDPTFFQSACTGIGNWTQNGADGDGLFEAGETATCTVTGVPIPSEPAPEFYQLSGDITVTDTGGLSVTEYNVASEPITVSVPKMEVTKVVTDIKRAGAPVEPPANVGDRIFYTITVQNTGQVDLLNVFILDSLTGPVYLPPGTNTIPVGQSLVVNADYTVRAGGQDPLTNKVTVTATASGFQDPINGEASALVDIVDSALKVELAVVDPGDGTPITDGVAVGETVEYVMTITNEGGLDIAGLNFVTLTYPLQTLANDPPGLPDIQPSSLVAGGTMPPITWQYTVQADDDDPLVSTVRIRGTDEGSNVLYAQDQATVDISTPGLSVSSTVIEPETGTVLRGGEVVYEIEITNTDSSSTLCGVTLAQYKRDPDTGLEAPVVLNLPLTWPPGGTAGQLEPGQSATATVTYLVTGEDKDPLHMIFEANTTGPCGGGDPITDRTSKVIDVSDAQVNVSLTPDVEIAQVDQSVEFVFQAQNIGSITLESVSPAKYCIYHGTEATGTCNVNFTLSANDLGSFEAVNGSFSHTITSDDAAATPFLVEVTMTGTDNKGNTVSIKAATTLSIGTENLFFEATGPSQSVIGDDEQFGFAIGNETGMVLRNARVYNMLVEDPSDPYGYGYKLEAEFAEIPIPLNGELVTGSFGYTIAPGVGIKGDVFTMQLRLLAETDVGPVVGTATFEVLLIPMVTVIKEGDTQRVAGQSVHYTVTIINNSSDQNLTLTEDSYEDAVLTGEPYNVSISHSDFTTWPGDPGILPPGASVSADLRIPGPPEDAGPGVDAAPTPLVNTFIVTGTREYDDAEVSGLDTHSVRIECPVQITFEITNLDGVDADDILGETLEWQINVTNQSLDLLQNVVIYEDLHWGGAALNPATDIDWPGTEGEILAGATAQLNSSFNEQITNEYYSETDPAASGMPDRVRVEFSSIAGTSFCEQQIKYPIYSPIGIIKIPSVLIAFTGDEIEYDFLLWSVTEEDDGPYADYYVTVYDSLLTPNPVPFDYNGDGTIDEDETSGWVHAEDELLNDEGMMTYEVQPNDPAELTNQATAEFPDPTDPEVLLYTSWAATVFTGNPLQLTKTPSSDIAVPGTEIYYDYTITNVSPYDVINISIVDEPIGDLVPGLTGGLLNLPANTGAAPPELQGVVYPVPLEAVGTLVNTVTATGTVVLPDGSTRPIESKITVAVDVQDSELEIIKTVVQDEDGSPGDPLPDNEPVNGDGIPEAGHGQPVHYCFKVTNLSPGTETYVDNILLTDTQFAIQSEFEAEVVAKYAPAEGEEDRLYGTQFVEFCHGPVPLNISMGDPVENVVTATGTASGGYAVFATDQVVVDLLGENLRVTKSPSQPLAYVGDEITYTIILKNLNEFWPITIPEGGVTDRFGDGGAAPIPLSAFNWSGANPTGEVGVLDPLGGVATATYTYTIQPTDPSTLSNTATATGILEDGSGAPPEVADSTRAVVGVTASQLLVQKTATPNVARPGDTVRYQITILNVGTVPVYNLTVDDPAYPDDLNEKLEDTTLSPYETAFITYDLKMPSASEIQATPSLDPFVNTVTAQGRIMGEHGELLEDPVVGTATESVDILQPFIRITKSAVIGAATPGMEVDYRITISHRGAESDVITGLLVRDLVDGDTLNLTTLCPDDCPFTYGPEPYPGGNPNPMDGQPFDPQRGLLFLEQLRGTISVTVPEDWAEEKFTNVVEVIAQLDGSQVQDRNSDTIDIRDDGINVDKFASVSSAPVGTEVTYTVQVQNVGDNPIETLVLADNAMPGGSLTVDTFVDSPEDEIPGDDSATLDPGEVYETAYTHILGPGDNDPYVNTVSVTGYTATSSVMNIAEATVDIQSASLAVEKTVCYGVETGAAPGDGDDNDPSTLLDPCLPFVDLADDLPDTVTYYLHIRNTGPVEIINLAVTDNTGTPGALPTTTLAPDDGQAGEGPDETWIMYTYPVQPDDSDPLVNFVRVTGETQGGGQVQATDTASLALVTGDLQLTKEAVTQAAVGDDVVYTLTVTHVNPAGEPITGIKITDPLSSYGTDPLCTIPSLSYGTPETCTFTHAVTLADSSPLVNTAEAEGLQETGPSSGVFVTLRDTASHEIEIVTPGLSVTKQADTGIASIGDTITYTYTVTNTGSVQVDNLSVTDSDPLLTFNEDWPGYLPPGTAVTRTGTHVVTATDPDPLVNTVTVTGQAGPTDLNVGATETVFIANGSLVVTNTPNVWFAQPGTTVTFTYTVRNVGTEALDTLAISDTLCDSHTLTDTDLNPGESLTVYCEQAASLPGPLVSTVFASAEEPGPATVTDTATAEVAVTEGGMLVTKTADRTTASPGDTINYTVVVTNVGTEALVDFVFDDPVVLLEGTVPDLLPVGESFTLTGSYMVPGTDPPGSVANTVTVSAVTQTSAQDVQDSDAASVAILEIPGARLALTKEVSATRAMPGQQVQYTFRIQNVSAVSLDTITLYDEALGIDPLGIGMPIDPLAPGNTTTVTQLFTVPADYTEAVFTNTAEVRVGGVAEDTASVDLLVQVLTLEKTATNGPVLPGDTINYEFTITNNSSASVTGVTLTDPGVTFGTPFVNGTVLTAGQTVTGSYVVPEDYAEATYENTAILLIDGVEVDRDTEEVTVIQAGLEVEIDSITQQDPVTLEDGLTLIQTGEPANIAFTLRNTGDNDITAVSVTVDMGIGSAVCTDYTGTPLPNSLTSGDEVSLVCEYVPPVDLPEYELADGLEPEVTVSVTGTVGGQEIPPVTDTMTMPLVDLLLELTVAIDPVDAEVGDPVDLTFTVTNLGASELGCDASVNAAAACHLDLSSDNAALDTLLDGLDVANTVLEPGDDVEFAPVTGTAAPFTAMATIGHHTIALETDGVLESYTVEAEAEGPDAWSGLVIEGLTFTQEAQRVQRPNPFQTGEPIEVRFTLRNTSGEALSGLEYTVDFDIPDADPEFEDCIHESAALPDPFPSGDSVLVTCEYTPQLGLNSYQQPGGLSVEVTVSARGEGQTSGDQIDAEDIVTTLNLVDLWLLVEMSIASTGDDAGTTDVIEAQPGDTVTFTLTLTSEGASRIGCTDAEVRDEQASCHLDIRYLADPGTGVNLVDVFADPNHDGSTADSHHDTIRDLVLSSGDSREFVAEYIVADNVDGSRFEVIAKGGYYTAALARADLLDAYTVRTTYITDRLDLGEPAIDVEVLVSPIPTVFGQPVTYTVRITNTGPVTVNNLAASWTITPQSGEVHVPPVQDGIMLVSGWRQQALTGQLTLPVTTLPPGDFTQGVLIRQEDQTGPYTFEGVANGQGVSGQAVTDLDSLTLNPSGVPQGTLTPTVDPSTLDPTAVNPVVTKTASADSAQPGGSVTWTITVRNSHTNPMPNVVIQDAVPETLTISSSTTDRGVSVTEGNLVTVNAGLMNPGDEVTLTIVTTVNADAASPGSITNTACAVREDGGQGCGNATVNLGPDAEALPETGVRSDAGSGGWLAGLGLLMGALMLLFSAQVSSQRMKFAVIFVIVAAVIVGGGIIVVALTGGDDDEGEDGTDVAEVGPTPETPVAPEDTAEVPTPDGSEIVVEFPPTPTPYVLPTPSGPRSLVIPKLADQFGEPVPIVELPLRNRAWDISALGFYVGWLEGTTWFDPQWGNTVLSAHVQLGAGNPGPFWALDQLVPGDEIVVIEGDLERRFTVQSISEVPPDDWTVTAPTDGPTLTLITCTGWEEGTGIFRERLVVRAVPMTES